MVFYKLINQPEIYIYIVITFDNIKTLLVKLIIIIRALIDENHIKQTSCIF